MFSYLTPEMLNLINESRRKNIPTFEEYFNKKYLEECKIFFEKPRFSIKSMIIMNQMREVVRNRCIKEYKELYPWASIENQKKDTKNNTSKNDTFDKEFVILDKELEIYEDENQNKDKNDDSIQLRRSTRLKNKNNYNFHKT